MRCAEAADCVGYLDIGEPLDDRAAKPLQPALDWSEMGIVGDAAVTDHDIGTALDDRRDDGRDILARILAVGVGVDDNVGPGAQRGVEPRLEGGGKAAIGAVADDVMCAPHARDLRRVVGAAIVDDEDLDRIDSGNAARQRGERRRQILRLVQAGNLDNQFRHRPRYPSPSLFTPWLAMLSPTYPHGMRV